MIERKCLKCGTWNKGEDFCRNCNSPLSPKEIEKEKQKLHQERIAREYRPDRLEILREKARTSKYLIVRIGYYIAQSVLFVLMLLGSFFAWLIAWASA